MRHDRPDAPRPTPDGDSESTGADDAVQTGSDAHSENDSRDVAAGETTARHAAGETPQPVAAKARGADDPEPEADSSDVGNTLTVEPLSTVPPLRFTPVPWWRRWKLVAALVAVVVVLGTAGAVALAPDNAAERLVADYLEVLRSGDAEAALEYVPDHIESELLVPEAMATDWEVTRIFHSEAEDDDPSQFDVTITAADGSVGSGRFEVKENDDGGVEILNPLVRLNTEVLPMDYIEFNGVTTQEQTVWLFPGAYRAFESSADLFGSPTFVAVPRSVDYSTEEMVDQYYLPLFEVRDGLTELVEAELVEWIDGCVDSTEPSPYGCPFGAQGPYDTWVNVDGDRYYFEEVTWSVERYPSARVEQGEAGFTVYIVVPGRMAVSGTGERWEGGETEVVALCETAVNQMTTRLPADRDLTLSYDGFYRALCW